MKNSVRIWVVTFLAAVYCFAAIKVTYSPESFDLAHHSTTEQGQYFGISSKSLFQHTSPSESPVNSFNDYAASNFKDLFDKLWALTHSSEDLFEAEYTQYCNFSINFLIKYRKTDLIFPFHYFW